MAQARTTRTAGAEKTKASAFADMLRKGRETYDAGKALEETISFDRVPGGQYIARLSLAEWRISKAGNIMLHREHTILEGEQKGRAVYDNLIYGKSDFGDAKIRQYVSLVTDQPAPDDPADLEPLVDQINSEFVYDCKLRVKYSGDDSDFANVDVMEVYDVDANDSPAPAPTPAIVSTSVKGKGMVARAPEPEPEPAAEEGVPMEDLLAFCVKQDIKIPKGKAGDSDFILAEIEKYEYDAADLSDEDKDLLEALSLGELIIAPPPPTPPVVTRRAVRK